jgi:hypothetical protein
VDRFPQVAAHRMTHVVSLSAVTIIAVVALAFADAPPLVYLLVTASSPGFLTMPIGSVLPSQGA